MEESENAVIKAIGKKKMTGKALEKMKEKVETLREKAGSQRKTAHMQRHWPKELSVLHCKKATGATGKGTCPSIILGVQSYPFVGNLLKGGLAAPQTPPFL